ncbi:MAG TPA: hypothetical protein VH477_12390 [Bryobacteraceae bacterium]
MPKFRDSLKTFTNFSDRRHFDLAWINQNRPARESLGFKVELPLDQLSIFARDADTGGPLARIPVYAIAEIGPAGAGQEEADDPDANRGVNLRQRVTVIYPLGMLATDQAGYASFDLTILRSEDVLSQMRIVLQQGGLLSDDPARQVTMTLSALRVLPFADVAIAFDALKEGDIGPTFISLRMEFDRVMMDRRVTDLPSVSMQNPNILDWRLSPGSFSMAGVLLIGESGCETLIPTNLATQMFRFRQIARTPWQKDLFTAGNVERRQFATFRFAYAIEYQTEWFPVGHSLGQILYSLPLAPGEKVKMAVVDWRRHDEAERKEATTEKEQLTDDQLRDRSLTEAVHMVVNESQHGSSFMAGMANSAGASIPLGVVDLGVGSAFSLGGSTASTSGTRDVTANTSQNISDAFHQSASALRDIHSTVVVQGDQAEQATAQTRIVANYNHSHALTMLYYEVLRHYRVVTRPASRRPALLITQPLFDFSEPDFILDNRAALEAALLDPSLKDCFSVVAKRQCLEYNIERAKQRALEAPDPADDYELGEVMFRVQSGAHGAVSNTYVYVLPKDGGAFIRCDWTDTSLTVKFPYSSTEELNSWTTPLIQANAEFIASFKPQQRIRWVNVKAIQVGQTLGGAVTNPPTDKWEIKNLRFTTTNGANTWVMYDGTPSPNQLGWNDKTEVQVKPYKAPIKDVDDLLTDDERCCIHRLERHLSTNQIHYSRVIWAAEEDAARYRRLANYKIGDAWLWDVVENRVLDIFNDSLAFPIVYGQETIVSRELSAELDADAVGTTFIEQLLTLPTRGVFAEAKLGHCNASEVIDTTRFWDWQTSPIPDDAPDIQPVDTGSRYQPPTGTTPTPFPQAIINMAQPQALPDPTGLSGAFQLMAALGPFKDLSGLKETSALLQTLSNNATQLAAKGLGIQGAKSMMDLIRSAPELSPDQKTQLIGDLLTGTAHQQTAKPADQTKPDKPVDPGKPAETPVPPKQNPPPDTPKPDTPKPDKPAKPPVLTPKSRRLAFVFLFDTGGPMVGEYMVQIADNQSGKTYIPDGDVRRTNMVYIDLPATVKSGITITINGEVKPIKIDAPAGLNPQTWSMSISETVQFGNLEGVTGFNVIGQGKDIEATVSVEKEHGSEWTHGTSDQSSVSVTGGGSIEIVDLHSTGGYQWTVQDDTKTTQGNKDVRTIKMTVRQLDPQKQPKVEAVK